MVRSNGSAFGRETRVMVMAIKEDIKEIKVDIQKISNHYSRRLPLWVATLITCLTSLCVGLVVRGLYV